MKKRILTALLSLFAIFAMQAASTVEAHRGEIPGGYNFWLAKPSDAETPKPVVIFLHGASLCGNNLESVKRYGTIDAVEKGREIDAYVLAPQNPGGAWKPSKIMEVLEWAQNKCNIDTTRVYVVGMSLGGYGTIDFTAAYPDKVAAAVAMCGGGTHRNLSALSEVPLWIIHGTADAAVSVSQSDKVVDEIKKADPEAKRLIYDRVPGMNHGRPARMFYIPEMYNWLFSHNLAQEGRPLQETIHVSDAMLNGAYKNLSFKRSSYSKSGNSNSSGSKKRKARASQQGKSKKK